MWAPRSTLWRKESGESRTARSTQTFSFTKDQGLKLVNSMVDSVQFNWLWVHDHRWQHFLGFSTVRKSPAEIASKIITLWHRRSDAFGQVVSISICSVPKCFYWLWHHHILVMTPEFHGNCHDRNTSLSSGVQAKNVSTIYFFFPSGMCIFFNITPNSLIPNNTTLREGLDVIFAFVSELINSVITPDKRRWRRRPYRSTSRNWLSNRPTEDR